MNRLSIMLALGVTAMAQIYGPPQTQVNAPPPILKRIGIDQQMGAQVPLDDSLIDESGREVTLREFTGKPIILALVYYQCPSLCNIVLNGVARATKDLPLYHLPALR